MLSNLIDLRKENDRLLYTGRIAWDDVKYPTFIWPATSLQFRFSGSRLFIAAENRHNWWENYIGLVIDGRQQKQELANDRETSFELALSAGEHHVMIYKPSDNFEMTIRNVAIDGELLEAPKRPTLRMEVYGDSVSAGEVCEAVDHVGQLDPDHDGEFNNCWHAYSWQCARLLGAELHDIAQGGIPLLRGTGFWHEPEFYGMEDIWDKTHYNPSIHRWTGWDFSLYTPDIVVVAIGQNDSNPDDFMKDDPEGKKASRWKERYAAFVGSIREKYPAAHIICMTTILEHDKSWDNAIDEAVRSLCDEKITHFLFKRNGCGTPGHPRIPEQTEMAKELAEYIRSEILY